MRALLLPFYALAARPGSCSYVDLAQYMQHHGGSWYLHTAAPTQRARLPLGCTCKLMASLYRVSKLSKTPMRDPMRDSTMSSCRNLSVSCLKPSSSLSFESTCAQHQHISGQGNDADLHQDLTGATAAQQC